MNGLDLGQFKFQVVQPALTAIGLMSTSALNLVTGTACVESGLIYVKQLNNGPALGLFQMEPATEQDIWNTYLNLPAQAVLRGLVVALVPPGIGPSGPTTPQLVPNMAYAAAMCRLKYKRDPAALPNPTDATAMAAYWKRVYNSDLGAGVVDSIHVGLFQAAISVAS